MNAQVINVHDELADAVVGKTHIRLGIILALLTLFDGYDTFNPAYVIHYVRGPWGLTIQQAGLLVSTGLIGFLCGATLHGFVADRAGRRITLLGGLWIATAFSLATAIFAHSFVSFCVIRVFTGIGLGVLLPLSTTYINELAPHRVANTFALWGVALGWAMGGAAAGIVGIFITPITGWQGLYWVGGSSVALIPLLYWYLPESPKFLALRTRDAELKAILSNIRPERAEAYKAASIADPLAFTEGTVSTLLDSRHRQLSIAIWSASFLSLFCVFGLTGWIPTLMQARGESFAVSFGFGALMQVMSFIGGLACGRLVDRFGQPRTWLSIWWFGGALSVLAMLFLEGHTVNLVSTAAAGFCIIGAQFVLNNFTAASYDTNVRATGVSMELGVGRLGAILGPFIGGVLQQGFGGSNAMLLAIAISATGAATTILFAIRKQSDQCSKQDKPSPAITPGAIQG